jgi:hypothetical protein
MPKSMDIKMIGISPMLQAAKRSVKRNEAAFSVKAASGKPGRG